MRLALFADLHLDVPFRWALRDTLDAIVAVAADEGVDALSCGGDLYEHEYVAPDTATVIRDAFARLDPTP